MNATETLVDYVGETSFEDLPDVVVDRAKQRILDSLGCALGGYRTKIGSSVIAALAPSEEGESTLIAAGRKIGCRDAAFINSTLVNALDFDDDNWVGHPSATTMPAALAMAEQVGASGREFLTSFVLGYEVVTRVGWAIWPSKERYEKVWGVGTHQSFGAVAAVSRLLGLNKFETLNAFGIAGAASPVPSAMKWGFDHRPLTWVKDSVAWAALAGITAGLLAKHGFLGCRDILDGETGFWIMAGSDRCDFDRMMRGLGREFEITKAAFKPYSSCRFTHATLDTVSSLVGKYNLKSDEIAEVLVKSIWDLTQFFADTEPSEIVDAEFSVPYTVAMVILRELPGPNWFYDDAIKSQKALELAKKVKIVTDSAADELYHEPVPKLISTVIITTKDGKKLEAMTEFAKGEPENPVSRDELEEKFRRLARFVLDKKETQRVLETVNELDRLKDINELTELLHHSE